MLYITLGFLLGFFIPYVVRRYFKIKNEPLSFAAELYWIFHINKHVSKQKYITNQKYLQLKNRYFMRSLGWGIIASAIFFLISTTVPPEEVPWLAFFVIMLLFLSEIDRRTELLPDLLTYPLLISGFLYAAFAGSLLADSTVAAAQNSALGALFGYSITTLTSLLLVRKNANNFGNGDVKILAAIGAWLGLTNIPFIILLSCVIFGIICFIYKKRTGAFGPAIVLATLLILFLLKY